MSFWKDSQTLDLYAEELFDQDSVIVEPQSAQILIFTLQQRLFVVNCTMECTVCNTSSIQLLEYELNSYLIQVLSIVFLSLKTLESRQYLLTLSAHAREGYSTHFVCHSFIHSVSQSVTLSAADLDDGRLSG